MIWSYLIHLGYNMWSDHDVTENWSKYANARPYLRCDKSLWDDIMKQLKDAGANQVVIDLGEGVKFESHPELAVKNSWSVDRLKRELAKMRKMGLEPIPKLNFSACHDQWLGPYSRMLSTPIYYQVCKDIIREAADIFDKPRFFHLGMDEETQSHQQVFEYAVLRQHDLWWRDFLFLVEQAEKTGARPWIWSDFVWRHPVEFFARMPKNVLQSNWYYDDVFNASRTYVKAYRSLEEHKYDQIPTGSNWQAASNFEQTVKYCKKHIAPERLMGFLQTVWHPTLEECRGRHEEAIECLRRGKLLFEGK